LQSHVGCFLHHKQEDEVGFSFSLLTEAVNSVIKSNNANKKQKSASEAERQTALATWGVAKRQLTPRSLLSARDDSVKTAERFSGPMNLGYRID
jgi:hypothetical protein